MKEELTREVVEAMAKCRKTNDCNRCGAYEFCTGKGWPFRFENLATALLEEMDKPKVWDGAPEDTKTAEVCFFNNLYCDSGRADMVYTRELPKTRIDKIVEEVIDGCLSSRSGLRMEKNELTEMLKSALEKYAAELKGEE